VTNCHVVASPFVQIQISDKRIFPIGSVIHADIEKDFCIVQIDADHLPALPLADTRDLRIGETIFTIGNPLDQRDFVSHGYIHSISDNSFLKLMELNMDFASGHSGGPVLNREGKVIGVITAILMRPIAVDIAEIKPFLNIEPKMSWYEFTQSRSFQSLSHYMQAVVAFEKGDMAKALENYGQSIEIFPTRMAYFNLGTLYYKLQEIEKALQAWESAIQINPFFKDPYFKIGFLNVLLKKKAALYDAWGIKSLKSADLANAIHYFQEGLSIIKNDPQKSSSANINLAMVYYYAGQYDKSFNSAQEGMGFSKENDLTAMTVMAKSYSAKGDIDRTKEYIEKLENWGEYGLAEEIEKEINMQNW